MTPANETVGLSRDQYRRLYDVLISHIGICLGLAIGAGDTGKDSSWVIHCESACRLMQELHMPLDASVFSEKERVILKSIGIPATD